MLLALILMPVCVLAQDNEKFSPTLLASARNGNEVAQNDLAIAYSEGRGIKSNQRIAVYWFSKSAEQGYVYGVCNLGLHYGWGSGIRRDYVQALKWSFIANSLDGLKCHPGDFVEAFKINECQVEQAWQLAVAWLRAHPKLENLNFGGRPWMEEGGEYGVTVRERGAQVQLPIKPSGKCKQTSKP
jgi:hypothetical protein